MKRKRTTDCGRSWSQFRTRRTQTGRLLPSQSTNIRTTASQHALSYQECEARAMLASFVPGELLVQFASDDEAQSRMTARALVDADLVETIHTSAMRTAGVGPLELIRLPLDQNLEEAAKQLMTLPGVQFAEPNWIYQATAISNDTYYTNGNLWGMYSSDSPSAIGPAGTTNQFGSQAERAWNAGILGSSNVVVGIIDEGFQVSHPELSPNTWVNTFDPVDGIDNDGNGYIDDVNGWDFVSNNNTVYDGTSDDHGTHVAGTIGGAGGNGTGVVGVNWDVTMISLKFLGSSGGTTANAIKAIDYLTDLKTRHGMNVVASNNSWGGGGFSSSLLAAITRSAQADILFVAAAGNNGSNNNSQAFYPANYDTTSSAGYDAVISVASIASSGARSSFSNYGATTVDLGAPGSSIFSTVPSNSYSSYSGTSMATPHVTGAVALFRSVNPNISAQGLRSALLQNTTATTSLSGVTVTGGRLDVWKLVNSGPSLPNITIGDVSVTEGNSGTTSAVFTVSLSSAASSAVTVNFSTADQTAFAGNDYVANAGSLTFSPGELSKTISIDILGDSLFESSETFTVNLSGAVGANISDNQAVGTITNDDVQSLPDISISDVSLNEGNTNTKSFAFRVTLSAASTLPVRFDFNTVDGTAVAGSDYLADSGRITFNPGQTAKNVRINVIGDTTPESIETFFVNIFAVTNANVVKSQGLGTIRNDDGSGSPVSPNGYRESNNEPLSGTESSVWNHWQLTQMTQSTKVEKANDPFMARLPATKKFELSCDRQTELTSRSADPNSIPNLVDRWNVSKTPELPATVRSNQSLDSRQLDNIFASIDG